MNIDAIKEQVSLLDVLDWLDLDRPSREGKIFSITHDERTPSLHIYDDNTWWDFSTGQGGDVISFVQTFFGTSWKQAVQWLDRMAGGIEELDDTPTPRERQQVVREVVDLTDRLEREAKPIEHANCDVQRFIEERWNGVIGLYQLHRFGVHCTETSLWIPHSSSGVVYERPSNVVGIKVRGITGDKYSVKGSTFTNGLYTPGDVSFASHKVAVIVEGEPDTWAAYMLVGEGSPTWHPYGLPSGASAWRQQWNPTILRHKGLIVATDKDDAGDEAYNRIRTSIWNEQSTFPITRLKFDHGKDLIEALAYSWDHALRQLEDRVDTF